MRTANDKIKSKIVTVNAMEALAMLAIKNRALSRDVKNTITSKVATGSPAIQARGRKLLKRLAIAEHKR